MFRFRRKKAADPGVDLEPASTDAQDAVAPERDPAPRDAQTPGTEETEPAEEGRLFGRLRAGLARSRSSLAEGVGNLLLGKKEINEDVLEELETQLLMADVGIEATSEIIDRLAGRVRRRQLADADALMAALAEELTELLAASHVPFGITSDKRPFVILVVGVNGVGKTTTIGKLARRFMDAGLTPILAAGDTFRAAAVQQLQAWGERNGVEVIAQGEGADSASVIFDALSAARSRGADVVLADTAGRLHNKAGLMEELAKVGRIMARFDADAPHAALLVLDAGTGQNALAQAREFAQAVPLTGIVLTKLDGTAKGGIAFAIARQSGLPIQFIGVGEQAEDLRAFEPADFVAALLDRDEVATRARP
ncbi:MAG: signal recognition particle-docking protein FtsY [Pseudomonadales bacterium]|jgi:fused signal recognition particle receptor|nr:signal recognition particle-docking protein FtsY [Pseudomonadales bacterium]